jgi:hypothetical protein
VLMIVVAPVPVCETPVMVNAVPLVNERAPPPVLVALKLPTTFAPFNVSPPTEFVVNKPPLTKPEPLSDIVPLEVRLIALPVPAATLPVILKIPVLLTVTVPPVLVCVMPVTFNVLTELVKEITPVPLFVALKLLTPFTLPNVVLVPETVVNKAPLIVPAPPSFTVAAVPVKLTLPVVLILPAFKITL